jgi:hypothetical protein
MDIQSIIIIASGIMIGARIIAKTIAPFTQTHLDDKLVAFLDKALEVLSLHIKDE